MARRTPSEAGSTPRRSTRIIPKFNYATKETPLFITLPPEEMTPSKKRVRFNATAARIFKPPPPPKNSCMNPSCTNAINKYNPLHKCTGCEGHKCRICLGFRVSRRDHKPYDKAGMEKWFYAFSAALCDGCPGTVGCDVERKTGADEDVKMVAEKQRSRGEGKTEGQSSNSTLTDLEEIERKLGG